MRRTASFLHRSISVFVHSRLNCRQHLSDVEQRGDLAAFIATESPSVLLPLCVQKVLVTTISALLKEVAVVGPSSSRGGSNNDNENGEPRTLVRVMT